MTFREGTWTRELDPFGITVNCREVKYNKIVALQFGAGSYIHGVDRAILEWVVGAPKMHIRYLLTCGYMGKQTGWPNVRPITNKAVKLTCPKCRRRQ